jgi:hypothetical protein
MNDDLAAVLRSFVDAESDLAMAAAPEPSNEAGDLARRVSRRRAVRTAVTTLSAAALVVAVVVGVHSVQRPDPGPPAIPAPLISAHPSPSPTDSSTAAALPKVTTDPLLPAAEPMRPGMLEAADSSWRLFRFEAWATINGAPSPAVVYLLSPDGHTYEVPTSANPVAWDLLDWLPGTSLAIVDMNHTTQTRVIDLVSGATVLDLGSGYPPDARFVHDGTHDAIYHSGGAKGGLRRVTMQGQVRATTSQFSAPYATEPWLLSPQGSAVLVNDAAGPRLITSAHFATMSMQSPYPARPDACRAWKWVTETEVLEECAKTGAHAFQPGQPSEFWLTTVGNGKPRQLSGLPVPEATRLGGLWQVGNRLVAGSFGPSETEAGWWDVGHSGTTPLSHGGTADLTVVDVAGAELIAVSRTPEAGGARSVTSLVAIDPVRGTTRTLVTAAPAATSTLALAPSSSGPPPQTGVGD